LLLTPNTSSKAAIAYRVTRMHESVAIQHHSER
jgi:hypothetical protein